MKTELRGKSLNDFVFSSVYNFRNIIKNNGAGVLTTDFLDFCSEFRIEEIQLYSSENPVELIKSSILELYNSDINSTVFFLNIFLSWYKDSCNHRLDLLYDDRCRLLEFTDILTDDIVNNRGDYLNQKSDKYIDDDILVRKIKLLSKLGIQSKRGNLSAKEIENNINILVDNCKYLNLIKDNGDIDRDFLTKWEYYPVNDVFRSVINNLINIEEANNFQIIKDNEKKNYDKIVKGDINFSSIKPMKVKKEGKIRKIYIVNEPIDIVALKYLTVRLNSIFKIKYPCRDNLMETCFNLIDSLPDLENYTIFRFDFENFFDSVDIKQIFDNYIRESNLCSFEKNLLEKICKKYKYCPQGLSISNALIEIISREFDARLRIKFRKMGLIYYERYVDDGILIFNEKRERRQIEKIIKDSIVSIFGEKVKMAATKTVYQTKKNGSSIINYLGYSFKRVILKEGNSTKIFFQFGISDVKLEKYKKQLDNIFKDYLSTGDDTLFLKRIQYYNSRVVFYNHPKTKNKKIRVWDVRGIINSYRLLRKYIIQDAYKRNEFKNVGQKKQNKVKLKNKKQKKRNEVIYKIDSKTANFLYGYILVKRNELQSPPSFLVGKNAINHSLWQAFIYNNSIVFQPNIGWSDTYLNKQLMELNISGKKQSYTKNVKTYCMQMGRK